MKQQDLFGFEEIVQEESDKKYSKKVQSPVYTPRTGGGNLLDCYDQEKYKRLCRIIDNANVSDNEKIFLKLAATRFIEFNYESIADYYAANASNEMQNLMERLAVVIVDFDSAIERGFVQLNDKTRIIYEQERND